MSEQSLVVFSEDPPITIGRIRAASVLDAINVTNFGSDLANYVEKHPGLYLLLDFEDVDYLSSAVLTELLRINKLITESGGLFRLCALNPDIRKVFEITNLDKLFVIYESLDDGVRKFKRSLDIEAQQSAWDDMNKKL